MGGGQGAVSQELGEGEKKKSSTEMKIKLRVFQATEHMREQWCQWWAPN